MLRFLRCLLLPALVVASPSQADSNDYAQIGDWGITRTTHNSCYALLIYEEISLAVEYDAKDGHVLLFLGNKNATSLTDNQKVKLEILFTRGGRVDDGWGEQEFTAHVDESGTPLFSSNGWFSTEMLDDIAKNDYFMVMNGDKLVSGAKLQQSAALVSKLRECSMKAANLNPKDPFLH